MAQLGRMNNTNNITNVLRAGYSMAKNQSQYNKVKAWHKKVTKTVANCHSMLNECDRLDAEFDKVAKRLGLK